MWHIRRRYTQKLLVWGCGESSSGGSCLQCHVSFLPFALLFFLPMFSTMLDIDLPLGTMATLKMTRWNDLDYITELLHQPQAASSRLPVIRKIKPQFVQVTVLTSQIQFLNRRPQRHLYHTVCNYFMRRLFKKAGTLPNLRCPRQEPHLEKSYRLPNKRGRMQLQDLPEARGPVSGLALWLSAEKENGSDASVE